MAKQVSDIDSLLKETVEAGATDLHLSTGAQPRYRLHGKITNMQYAILSPKDVEHVILPLMDTLARSMLNTTGQYDFAYTIPKVARFRVNVFKQKGDMAGVFRVLNDNVPEYTKLGLPYGLFQLYKKRRGLILVVGPTGSGKSTTLASFLDIINKNLYKHIVTLEDPIEYLHWHKRSLINQREIGTDCDSFANGLRAALREDPDVILIGEMRDLETTEIAITSAETGHLVCSTLHTIGAAATVDRIIDMYPEKQQNQIRSQLVGILEAVVSQQLLPKADGSGYIVAYEIMYKNKAIQRFIKDKDTEGISNYLLTKEAINEGMVSMDATIFKLYSQELITKDTALDFALDRKQLEQRINTLDRQRDKRE